MTSPLSSDAMPSNAADIATAVRSGQHSAAEFARTAFTRLRDNKVGRDGLNAVVHEDLEGALHDAEQLSARLEGAHTSDARNTSLELAGVPVVIKDNIATLRMPTACGSRILANYVSPYEATAITRLRNAGALIVGKSNMDEFAMGSSTENSAYGPARNPLDPTRVPGGSSGGSAVAVAAGVAPIALGSETGGSVRQPAAFCGIVGVKPTYGRVSRFGLVAFASSLDHIGVFGKTVCDAALGFDAIQGHDVNDATSANVPVTNTFAAISTDHGFTHSLKGIVVGLPREYFPATLDPDIRDRTLAAVEKLRDLGAEIRDVSLPHTSLAIPVYYIIAPAEASSNLARFDGIRYGNREIGEGLRGLYEATRSGGFGPEVTRRILLGTYVLSAGYYDAYYRRAQAVRALIAADFATAFASGVHVLFTPTAPTTAFAIGAVSDPYEMYLSDIFTVTANLAGIPAMSQPIGLVNGLPVGGQLLARHFDEVTMFRVARALERVVQHD